MPLSPGPRNPGTHDRVRNGGSPMSRTDCASAVALAMERRDQTSTPPTTPVPERRRRRGAISACRRDGRVRREGYGRHAARRSRSHRPCAGSPCTDARRNQLFRSGAAPTSLYSVRGWLQPRVTMALTSHGNVGVDFAEGARHAVIVERSPMRSGHRQIARVRTACSTAPNRMRRDRALVYLAACACSGASSR